MRYRIEGEPLASGVCHCRTCRRIASAPTLPFLVLAAGQFAVTRGSPAEVPSSPGVTRAFCGRCGSPLTYRAEAKPDRLDVMTCSLDDPEVLPPTFHVWAGHRLAWDRIEDGLPTFETTRSAG